MLYIHIYSIVYQSQQSLLQPALSSEAALKLRVLKRRRCVWDCWSVESALSSEAVLKLRVLKRRRCVWVCWSVEPGRDDKAAIKMDRDMVAKKIYTMFENVLQYIGAGQIFQFFANLDMFALLLQTLNCEKDIFNKLILCQKFQGAF